MGNENDLISEARITPAQLSTQHWISIGETAGLFDGPRETLDLLGLNEITPTIEDTGDVHMIFRILERAKACAVLPVRQLGVCRRSFGIVPVELELTLPDRPIGLWTSFAALDRPEVVDFRDRLTAHVAKLGLT